ncbi:oxygen-dependent coproporphyrinogen-III oxidase, chloroplastic-like [Panicum miliaceum]|uniref:Oxygen-dependent coproporphyrinogen-III oxidase, chloroplastic-like n=1 Tax=Panicum miliaceum TaxID=4540 RepID=A0A3L6RNC3_PANMI|nr:oxygen-dependent coproporphyrinogen-III oxidase, chloroplastic-like [Panicum miliaceum]
MDRETPELAAPATFLRGEEGASPESVRARFERMIRRVQAEVCAELEAVEGGASDGGGGALFREDAWTRPGGGGGISRVLQGGRVFEKAAVNVSVVYGVMPPEAYRAARPEAAAAAGGEKAGPVPFFAAGVSSVIHPVNPFAPTMHFNYRYFETEAPKVTMEDDAPFSADAPGAPRQWWFGGGTDLTPSYIIEEDVKHFHSVQKQTCDKFDPCFYSRFKKWCDDYFYIKETLLQFATECADSVLPAYIPIIERRKDIPFTEEHKAWQQLRRGLLWPLHLLLMKVYDRGTTFGLKTGGRIESILVSLPLTARWEYDHKPELGSEEWKLLDTCINPKEWI